jgi:hypothetical protein
MSSKPSAGSYRDSLNGSWKLDKSRDGWSMRAYLAVMEVDPLAIEAHDRAEQEADTIHTISVVPHKSYHIIKQSRVNNDLITELPLDGTTEATATVRKILAPGDRLQTSRATSNDGGKTHISILSTIETVNGTAVIVDTKELLQQEEDEESAASNNDNNDNRMMISTRSRRRSVLKQTLVITNQANHKTCRTTRYFVPVDQHKADDAAAVAAVGAGDAE